MSASPVTKPTEQTEHHSPRKGLDKVYVTDTLTLQQTLLRMAVAGALAAAMTLVAWFVLGSVQWPSYNNSFVLRAISTAGTTAVIAVAALTTWLWLHPPKGQPLPRWMRLVTHLIAYLAPAALVITTLAIPLAATRLYLEGISVDQGFRTQFLTRMTDQLGWHDMAYIDMPSFYPGLWFFSGGAFAKLTGLAGWAAFKPWALITLAVASAMLVPVWQRLTGSLAVALAITLTTTAIMVRQAPDEPYAAIVAIGMPAAFLMSRRALEGGKAAIAGNIIYLGLSANLYTLFTGISALTIVIMAFVVALVDKSWKPIWRLIVIGVSSLAIAAIGWGPYLWAMLTQPHGPSKAQHYLPKDGTEIPMPFFDNITLFLLGAIAIIWIIARFRDADVHSMAVGLAVCYGWVFLSLLATIFGTTLLAFRVWLPIALILSVSAVLALAELRIQGLKRFYPQQMLTANTKVITGVMAVFLAATCVHFVTTTTNHVRDSLDAAYTDTDGDAVRGDRMPADATQYYATIDQLISGHTGSQAGTIVLTDEKNFMSYYPYHGYQAITAHYSNPLGEFERRNQAIEAWTTIDDPQELRDAMDAAERDNGWQAPDALVLRGQLDVEKQDPKEENSEQEDSAADPLHDLPKVTGPGDGTFSYQIADDIYPSNPNVRFRTVNFQASAFADGWELHQVGPFVVALRTDA
ncbi:galactan 5-O-arabinofuranosyltransferase [Corynebacterium sp. ED61]|uniref:galactan 5-O-arabinofuranosyltransferase n=1 Tax=Corynebacterium sp. ED61 TaxID=2211360 RepID=UPI0018839AF9|nr:galactan 5-O-arabinofuranosyltransferase [Corynebacterium sp. ED61]MBF0582439.1 galactan 5-O-arabinofuranosyltransferase [Corynebacterium sp. ED61]